MEGNENRSTASRGRAVRPVRRTAGSSSADSAGRFPDETRSRRSTAASERSSYSGREGSANRRSTSQHDRAGGRNASADGGSTERRRTERRSSERTDTEYRRNSAGRSDYRTERRRYSEEDEGTIRTRRTGGRTENTRSTGRRTADTDVRRRESDEEREARERRRRIREERQARERRLQLREEAEPEKYGEEGETRERSRSTRTRNTRNNRRTDLTTLAVNPRLIGVAAGLLLIIIVIIVGVRSLGSSHKSAANVAKSLIQASVDGNAGKMKDAYGISGDAMIDMQESLDATIAYYEAHDVKKVNIKSTGTLFEEGDYTYLYVLYNLVLENDQEYPCIGTYIMQNVEGKYYVLPPSKVTEDLSQKATDAYQKFMTTDTYKNYSREYDTFIKKNPGYEEKISEKLA